MHKNLDSKSRAVHRGIVLTVVLAGAFMALLDTSIVNVALPSMRHALFMGDASLEWLISGYALAFGLSLVPAGRIGDSIGRKHLFVTGLGVFLLASLAAGLSQTTTELVSTRIIQGLAAGVFSPQITAVIADLFQGKDRSRAFGLYGATIGIATALGPLIGGLLIQEFGAQDGWRWVFFVNLFIGVIALPMAMYYVPAGIRHPGKQLDLIGTGLLTAGLLLVLFPLTEGQSYGWPIWTYVCLVCALPIFVILALWERTVERRGRTPLIPPHILRHRSYTAGVVFALVYFAAFTSIFFDLSVALQSGLGKSALATGLTLMPFAIGNVVGSANSARVSARLGRNCLIVGCSLVMLGLVLLELIIHHDGYNLNLLQLILPLLIMGVGSGFVVAPNQDFTLSAVEGVDMGSGAGLLNTAQRVGSAIGIAIVGTVLFSTLHILPEPHGLARAFIRSLENVTLVNIGLVILSLLLVLGMPKKRRDKRTI